MNKKIAIPIAAVLLLAACGSDNSPIDFGSFAKSDKAMEQFEDAGFKCSDEDTGDDVFECEVLGGSTAYIHRSDDPLAEIQ